MNALKLESALAEPIHRLIELRQIEGSDYHTQAQLLVYFDRFLVEQKLAEPRLTRPLVEAYEETLSRLAPRGGPIGCVWSGSYVNTSLDAIR